MRGREKERAYERDVERERKSEKVGDIIQFYFAFC